MRTHYCNSLSYKDINKNVKLCGWVQDIRLLKSIIFIDLKDCSGNLQLIILSENIKLWNLSKSLTHQSCIKVNGIVKKKNNNKIEILVNKLIVFNYSKLLPLDIFIKNSEKIKFKYRYLDFRNKKVFKIFKIRSKVKNIIYNYFEKRNFLNIETPFLNKSFFEGSRDFLVPSRLGIGKNYSLPQSPQIFKQLLMIGGIDKYYQIVKCFRDEDLRSDRQPEFTQLDLELSFVNFNFIKNLIDKLINKIWFNILGINLCKEIKVIKYSKCLVNYSTDKPDLRNPIKFEKNIYNFLVNNKILFKNSNYTILSILLINKDLKFDLNDFILFLSNKNIYNIIFLKVYNFENNKFIYKWSYNYWKLDDNLTQKLLFFLKSPINCVYFIFIGKLLVYSYLLKIRNFFCDYFKLFNKNKFIPIWIKDFPMFYYDKHNKINSFHHLFTKPKILDIKELKICNDYTKLLANSYDLVINGFEIGSGSERINNYIIQKEIFNILKINKNIIYKDYGFFLNSLKYGTPPHIGIALGLDRIIMLLTKRNNIREVIAFPKSTSGKCFVTNAPD